MIKIIKTDGLIGIQTNPAKMKISQPKVDFELRQKQPKIILQAEPIQVKIDQSQCRNEIGFKTNTAFGDDNAARGKQAASEGIDRIVSEGNQLAAIENRADAIAEIAAQNTLQIYDFNIEFLPKSRPQIDFVGGKVDIKVDEGYVDVISKPNKPIIDVESGSVEIFMRQKPEIHFEYIGQKIDKSI